LRFVHLLAAACLSATGICGHAAAADTTSFVASGTGKVVVRPDIAFVSIGFSSKGKTPEAAVELDGKTVGDVTKALKGAGVEPGDLQTANYLIDEVDGPHACGQDHDNEPFVPCKVVGYEIKNSLTVRIRDLAHYPQVLEAAIKAGLSDIRNITLAVSDPRPYEDQAYAAALLAAKAKAELTAKTLGFKLGTIMDVGANFQSPVDTPAPATLQNGLATGPGEYADLGIIIEPGELTFSRDASITYQIIQEQ